MEETIKIKIKVDFRKVVHSHNVFKRTSDTFGDSGEIYTYYYAEGKETNIGFTVTELQIRDWLVN
ncbi:MAG TPA: hypothetical protein VFP87_14825 [Chitinophagaceae bacterium]|nr:hypothetical protein [Chitinophagaceae bacterium]